MIAELAEAERPREKLLAGGPEQLSDAELLGLLLGTGSAGQSAVELGRNLLASQERSLGRLARVHPVELQRVKGLGPAKAALLRAAFELARRLAAEQTQEARPAFADPATAARWLLPRLQTPDQEEFHVLLLDIRHRLLASEMVTRGILDRTSIHPREVFRRALRHPTARVLIAHNHPSGDPAPSPADLEVTCALSEAGRALGIELLDHVIVGSAAGQALRFVSLRERGQMG